MLFEVFLEGVIVVSLDIEPTPEVSSSDTGEEMLVALDSSQPTAPKSLSLLFVLDFLVYAAVACFFAIACSSSGAYLFKQESPQ